MGKLIKLKANQLLMLKEYETSLSTKMILSPKQIKMLGESISKTTKLKNTFKSEFRKAGSDIQTEEDNLLGHPVQGDGSDYKPQTEKENEATFNENENENENSRPSLNEFTTNLLEHVRNIIRKKKGYPKFFKENNVNRKRLNKTLRKYNIIKDTLIGEDTTVKVNRDLSKSIKRLYELFFPGDLELTESIIKENTPLEPTKTNNDIRKIERKKVQNNKFKELFTGDGMSILTDGKYHYFFDFQNSDQEEFEDYMDRLKIVMI